MSFTSSDKRGIIVFVVCMSLLYAMMAAMEALVCQFNKWHNAVAFVFYLLYNMGIRSEGTLNKIFATQAAQL